MSDSLPALFNADASCAPVRVSKQRACVVVAHHAGLFSLINKVITCAERYSHVHVDFSNGSIYSAVGDNLWNHLFEPTENQGGPIIEAYPDQLYTYKNVAECYNSGSTWRHWLNHLWKRFTPLPSIVADVQAFVAAHSIADCTAVQVRSVPHAGEQLTGECQTLERYAQAIRDAGGGRVFAVCGDQSTMDWLAARFDVTSDPQTRRSPDRSVNFHEVTPQTVDDAVQCFKEVMVMSHAKALIHPISNMATAALYMNRDIKSIYLP